MGSIPGRGKRFFSTPKLPDRLGDGSDLGLIHNAGRAEPSRAEPIRAEPIRAEPIRAEPSRAELNMSGPS
jgi:hypothetical protein